MSIIQTASGHSFDYLWPSNSTISIEDIAHHLSNLCRFAGAVRVFYSVAQHSVLVSRLVPPDMALAGLLHDAAEAYMVDVPRPLKQLLPDYKRIEKTVEREVYARFGLRYPLPDAVHEADVIARFIEQRDLMPPHSDASWKSIDLAAPVVRDTITPLPPVQARELFLFRYAWLSHGSRHPVLHGLRL